MFKVGDKVQWTSSAGGVTRRKVGVVVEVVPGGMPPTSNLQGPGRARREVSYVVRGIALGTETEHRRLYWPRTSVITAYEEHTEAVQ